MPHADFDWQIGEDKSDERQPDQNPLVNYSFSEATTIPERAVRSAGISRRSLFVVVLIIGLIAASSALLLARRAEEVVAPLKEDIVASYGVVQYAITQSDENLFGSLLVDDYSFRSVEQQLFRQTVLIDRRAFGLRAQVSDPQNINIVLEPELTEAEVTTEHPYLASTSDGLTEMVWLRQTTVFRFEDQRWRIAPPSDQFWGDVIILDGQFLTLESPARDEEISRRLAYDLDTLLARFCVGSGGIGCRDGFHVRLRLDTSLSSLVNLFGPERPFGSAFLQRSLQGIEIKLPTPTLVGLPIDEASYQALYRGYASHIVQAVVIAVLRPPSDSATTPIYRQVADQQSIQLGLRAWPVASVVNSHATPPIPLPDQDLALYCLANPRLGGTLFRYIPATNTWSEELSGRFFAAMNPLPNDTGIVVLEVPGVSSLAAWRLLLVPHGREQLLLAASSLDESMSREPVYFSGQTDPSGRKIIVRSIFDQSPSIPYLLDLDGCTPTGCSLTQLWFGWPNWSPDGAQTILSNHAGSTVMLGDATGQLIEGIGPGHGPFWLDNQTYAYSQHFYSEDGHARSQLVTATASDAEAQVLVSSEELAAAWADKTGSEDWQILSAALNPANPNWILIRALAYTLSAAPPLRRNSSAELYFLFDRQARDVSLRFAADSSWAYASFSPDGQWLVATDRDATGAGWLIQLLGLKSEDEHRFTIPTYPIDPSVFAVLAENWSADRQWFFALTDGVLHLIAPAHDYHKAITPPMPGCMFAAWTD
ncbi:MAG TPA: hypothetical protein VJG32_19060 [Anaerolineae bacterium]|nr:hypothetical protein [Anaerolineae bacterium]